MSKKTVAVCDPIELFREGVARVLDASRYEVTLSVRSLNEVTGGQLTRGCVDIIVLGVDDDLPSGETVRLLESLSDSATLVLVLARSPTRTLIKSATSAGVRAVLSKDISGEIFSSALDLVLVGHRFYPAYDDPNETEVKQEATTSAKLLSATSDRIQVQVSAPESGGNIQFSEREEQILCRLISGAPNKSIARDLEITDATVKVHIKGLLRKLRVANRTQAAIWGMSYGFGDGRRIDKRPTVVPAPVNGVYAPN